MITQEKLKEYATYDPETGVFTRIKSDSRRHLHSLPETMGSKTGDGYLSAMVCKRTYPLHKLAVLYMEGTYPDNSVRVDHDDRDTLNNRWNNLRVVSMSGNIRNQSQTKSKTASGHTGIFFKEGAKSPWKAHIRLDGKLKHLGSFMTLDEALAVRKSAHEEAMSSIVIKEKR